MVTSLEKFVFASHLHKPKIRNKARYFPKPITSQTLLNYQHAKHGNGWLQPRRRLALFCFHQAGDDGGNQTMGWMDGRTEEEREQGWMDLIDKEEEGRERRGAPLKGGFHPLPSLTL